MTFALTAALILSIALAGWLIDRKDARSKLERDHERDERQVLLQRIQAPEAAVYEHAAHQSPDSEPFPQSDEQIAEEEERRRVIQFIERHEG